MADFLIATCPVPAGSTDKGREADVIAVLTERVGAMDNEAMDEFESRTGNDEPGTYLDAVLAAWAYLNDTSEPGPRDCTTVELAECGWSWLAGGMSSGDDPSEAFTWITVLDASGVCDEPMPWYVEPPDVMPSIDGMKRLVFTHDDDPKIILAPTREWCVLDLSALHTPQPSDADPDVMDIITRCIGEDDESKFDMSTTEVAGLIIERLTERGYSIIKPSPLLALVGAEQVPVEVLRANADAAEKASVRAMLYEIARLTRRSVPTAARLDVSWSDQGDSSMLPYEEGVMDEHGNDDLVWVTDYPTWENEVIEYMMQLDDHNRRIWREFWVDTEQVGRGMDLVGYLDLAKILAECTPPTAR